MVERFLEQNTFTSQEDFKQHLKIKVPDNFNFGYDIVDKWAEEEPDRKALLWTNDQGEHIQFTYADLKRETDKVASYLQSLGIGHGDMVMLILKRRYEFWLSMIALHKLGAVVIPATFLLTKKDIVYRCNAASIKAILVVGDEPIITHVKDALPDSPTVEQVISIGPLKPEGFKDFQEGVQHAAPFVRPSRRTTNDDTMLMYFTSGTSGEPKMVAHDFTYPLGHLVTAYYWHNLKPESLHLTIADTGWGKAVWGKLYGQMIVGSNIFVYDHQKFTPHDILMKIHEYHVTSLCAPPTIYRFLIKEDLSQFDFSNIQYACTAGEPLPPEVFNRFKEYTGLEIKEGFGQTETTLALGTFIWMEAKPGSVGKPSPAYKINLLDRDDNIVDIGSEGEICFDVSEGRSTGLFKEYYRNPEKTSEAWHDGYYHCGDTAWIDEDGYFHFVGRKDDIIKSSGYRIGPYEVESAVISHPSVLECAITGFPDPVRGQIVKATIVLAKGFEASDELAKEIQNHVKKVTAPYKYPRKIVFVDALPTTINGKIQRKVIRNQDNS